MKPKDEDAMESLRRRNQDSLYALISTLPADSHAHCPTQAYLVERYNRPNVGSGGYTPCPSLTGIAILWHSPDNYLYYATNLEDCFALDKRMDVSNAISMIYVDRDLAIEAFNLLKATIDAEEAHKHMVTERATKITFGRITVR